MCHQTTHQAAAVTSLMRFHSNYPESHASWRKRTPFPWKVTRKSDKISLHSTVSARNGLGHCFFFKHVFLSHKLSVQFYTFQHLVNRWRGVWPQWAPGAPVQARLAALQKWNPISDTNYLLEANAGGKLSGPALHEQDAQKQKWPPSTGQQPRNKTCLSAHWWTTENAFTDRL